MEDSIKVHVVRHPKRTYLYMRYVDPGTGKQVSRSTGTAKYADAVKKAAVWEDELNSGRYQRTSRLPWDAFRDQYEDATGPQQSPSTRRNYGYTLDAFETYCRPAKVGDLTTARVTAFAAELRKPKQRKDAKGKVIGKYTLSEPKSTSAIAGHLEESGNSAACMAPTAVAKTGKCGASILTEGTRGFPDRDCRASPPPNSNCNGLNFGLTLRIVPASLKVI